MFQSNFCCRITSGFIISHYIPITMFTWASFASFELRPEHGTDRMGYLMTLILVVVSMISYQTHSSPGGHIITAVGTRVSKLPHKVVPCPTMLLFACRMVLIHMHAFLCSPPCGVFSDASSFQVTNCCRLYGRR